MAIRVTVVRGIGVIICLFSMAFGALAVNDMLFGTMTMGTLGAAVVGVILAILGAVARNIHEHEECLYSHDQHKKCNNCGRRTTDPKCCNN